MSGALRLLTARASALPPSALVRSWLRAHPAGHSILHLSCSNWISLCPLSTRAATTPSAPKKRRGRKQKSAAASSLSAEAAPEANKAPGVSDDAEIMEKDVRLAIRLLMMHHLSHRSIAKKQGSAQLEKEREEFREKHEERERRLWIKDENSRRLLGDDGRSLGDGIVPIVPAAAQDPYREASRTPQLRGTAAAAGGGSGVWRALNPVGLAASQAVAGTGEDALSEEDYSTFLASSTASAAAVTSRGHNSSAAARTGEQAELEDWQSATLATLCAPNLSAYDTDHDFRVSSEDVVRQSQAANAMGQTGTLKRTVSSSVPSTSPYSLDEDALGEDMDTDLPAISAAQLKQQFAEEEDPDYVVSLYTANSDGDEDPFQL
ncbi:hypothetical protein ABL78_5379 [Leptomonas seymouri]|uniref:Uncharacterized protein n=1 Tax=Leptomonas seymouri TaxID=5684 RepID=A0A0N1I4X3_LEPSE|nr:hypothetical protein ABL78_5379 [Leptomonas seymouri]|eukprot:KPI85572.1 hypothetical protein ABL78_5379 [Leptomonas seymouri]